jgi:hypothetical protein
MAKDKKDDSQADEKAKGFFGNRSLVEIVGYIAVGLTTVVTTWLTIGDKFAKNMYEKGVHKDAMEERKKAYQDLFKKPQSFSELLKGKTEIEKKYKSGWNAMLKNVGVKNTLDKWRLLKSHQKIQISMVIASITTIATVGLVSFTRDRRLRHKLKEAEQHEAPKATREEDYQITEASEKSPKGEITQKILRQRETQEAREPGIS